MNQQAFQTVEAAERRESHRVSATSQVKLSIGDGEVWSHRHGRISDISRIGLRIEFDQPIAKDTQVSIQVDGHRKPVAILGRAIWCELSQPQEYIVGVELFERLQTREYVAICDAAEIDDGIRVA